LGAAVDHLFKAALVAWEEVETWAQMRKYGLALPFGTVAGPSNTWVVPELEG